MEFRQLRYFVAFFGSTIYEMVPQVLRRFHQVHPQIEISLTRMGKAERVNAIREGRIHVGFGRYYNQADGLVIKPITWERLLAAVPLDSDLAGQASVTLADLSNLPLVLFPAGDRPSFADEIISVFGGAGVEHHVDSVASDSTSVLALVASGGLCCVVPEAVSVLRMPGLTYLPISDCGRLAPASCQFAATDQPPVLREFLRILRADQERTPEDAGDV